MLAVARRYRCVGYDAHVGRPVRQFGYGYARDTVRRRPVSSDSARARCRARVVVADAPDARGRAVCARARCARARGAGGVTRASRARAAMRAPDARARCARASRCARCNEYGTVSGMRNTRRMPVTRAGYRTHARSGRARICRMPVGYAQ